MQVLMTILAYTVAIFMDVAGVIYIGMGVNKWLKKMHKSIN